MKRFYQTEWQGISFASFAKLSAYQLANATFYNAFYRELFKRYGAYEELDEHWRLNKKQLADWIAARLPDRARVLSVGCGLGFMEYCLQKTHGDRINLHVQDYASEALAWLTQVLPVSRIHFVGGERNQETERFDLIYLSAMDYAVANNELTKMLEDLKVLLREGGKLLIISASFQDETDLLFRRVTRSGKDFAKDLLMKLGLYHPGQFWGWLRTRSDYLKLMEKAKFNLIEDGFIVTPERRTYFIMGQ